MNKDFDKKRKRLIHSFKYAFEGVLRELKEEQNLKIHLLIMLIVILAGIFLKISMLEWIICIILFGFVISLELINTAIETTVDLAMPEIHEKAKIAKDVAAAAVLVAATSSAIIGSIIFLPKLFNLFI